MEIIKDLADLYDGFIIDLTNIGAGDKILPNKAALIEQFEHLLNQDINKQTAHVSIHETLKSMVPDSTNMQYHNGL